MIFQIGKKIFFLSEKSRVTASGKMKEGRERATTEGNKYRKFRVLGEWVAQVEVTNKSGGKATFLVDFDDWEALQEHYWYAKMLSGTKHYAMTTNIEKRKPVGFQTLVVRRMGKKWGQCQYRNRDRYDLRRANLIPKQSTGSTPTGYHGIGLEYPRGLKKEDRKDPIAIKVCVPNKKERRGHITRRVLIRDYKTREAALKHAVEMRNKIGLEQGITLWFDVL